MGAIIARERRKPAPRRPPPVPEVEDRSLGAPQSKAPSRVDTVKTEPPTLPCPKRAVEPDQELTEEMIEGLTRSSTDSANSKSHKKDVMENWLLRASYKVSPENDALLRHQKSMEALRKLPQTKKDRGIRPRADQSRSNSNSKGSRPRQPPHVALYKGVQAAA